MSSLSKELLRDNTREALKKLTFPSKASTGAYHPIRVLLYNRIYFIVTCAFTYRSLLKPINALLLFLDYP
jgi:hypothetical protein